MSNGLIFTQHVRQFRVKPIVNVYLGSSSKRKTKSEVCKKTITGIALNFSPLCVIVTYHKDSSVARAQMYRPHICISIIYSVGNNPSKPK